MRNTIMMLAAGMLLSVSTAALADDTPATPAPAQPAQAAPDKVKLVCKTMYHNGSLIHTQQCKTQAQWESERTKTQHDVADFQNRNYQTSSGK